MYVRTSAEWQEVMTQRIRRDEILNEKLAAARAEAEREIIELSEDWTEEQGSAMPAAASSPTTKRDDMIEDSTQVENCAFDEPHFDCKPCRAHFQDPALRREHERTAGHKELAGPETI